MGASTRGASADAPARSHPFTSLAALAKLVRALRWRRSASEMTTFFGAEELIFALVLKVGFAASLAALLVRFRSFRNLLFTEIRDSDQKVMLLLFLTPPLAIGVFLRLVGGYRFF